jgi:hypothetical protein
LEFTLKKFYVMRSYNQLRKKPSTSELIDWIGVLLKSGITDEQLKAKMPFIVALIN